VKPGAFFADGRSAHLSIRTLWAAAIELEAAIAIWRLPHSSNFHLLIDFSTPCEAEPLDIQDGTAGFVVSPFIDPGSRQTLLLRPQFHITFQQDGSNIISANEAPAAFWDALGRCTNQPQTNLKTYPGKQPDVKPGTDKAHFLNVVNEALKRIAHNELEKVIIARTLQVPLAGKSDLLGLLQHLDNQQPDALVSLIALPGLGSWMGASPELLAGIDREGQFRTISLAGTRAYPMDAPLSEAVWNQKEIEEQAMVSRFIVAQFKSLRLHKFWESGPRSVRAGSVIHLKTEYHVDMQAVHQPALGNAMLRLLHPTWD